MVYSVDRAHGASGIQEINVVKKFVDIEARTIRFDFDAGEPVVFELSKVSERLRTVELPMHGASQKLGDSYAGAGDEPDPDAFARASVVRVRDSLYAGDWRSASAAPRGGILTLAYQRASGCTAEEAATLIAGLTDVERKEMKKKKKIKTQIERIEVERKLAKIAKLDAQIAEEETEEKAA
jgi:hypothetical protein